MKRLLSTLTALCMCASMSVGMLPASALSAISTDDAAIVRADNGILSRVSADASHTAYEWSVLDATYDPADPSDFVLMPVNVWNDQGISGYEIDITVNGKPLTNGTQDDFPFTLIMFDNDGTAYDSFGQFADGLAKGAATVASASTDSDGASQVATSGGLVFTLAFEPKEDATFTPGAEYEVSLSNMKLSSSSGEMLKPVVSSGILKIAGENPDASKDTEDTKDTGNQESSDNTEASKPVTSDPGEDDGDPTGYAWKIGKETYDPDEKPEFVMVPVTVWNDPGISGYRMDIKVNGKALPDGTQDDFPFTLVMFDNDGTVYDSFGQFADGLAKGSASVASATTDSNGESQVAPQGGFVYNLVFEPKEGATFTPGTKYTISFGDETGFSNSAQEQLHPQLIDGAIIIKGDKDPEEPPKSDDYKWYVQDTTYDPAKDENILLNIKVAGDPGTNGYHFGITIDGKEATDADFPFVIEEILNGEDAYDQVTTFQSNPASGKANAILGDADSIAKEDGTAVIYVLKGKDGVTYEPGTKYEVAFAGSKFGNYAKDTLFPTLESGYITIAGEKPEETTESSEASEPSEETTAPPETKPTDPEPSDPPFEHKEKQVDAEWVIGNDTVAPGATVTIPVTVTGNTDGFNSYIADLSVQTGLVLKESGNGTLSDNLNFVQNTEKYIFSATDFTKDAEMIKGDGQVFYMTFTAPKEPGRYDINFESLEIYDIDMVQLIPKQTNGWIEVVADETAFDHKKQDTAAKWIIEKVEVDPGTTSARVKVSVEGASNAEDAINSYIAKIQQKEAGAKATGAEAGTAYAELGLQQNLKDLEYIFAGTSSTQGKENVTAEDGVVFYMDFEIPADAAPGTIYNLEFADIDLENADMVQLVPKTENGWIKIKEAETTTTPEPIEVGDAGEWVIGTATVAPGATVTIPVTVTGDKNGINSFIMKMGNPGIAGVTPTPESAEKGNAYGEQLSFVPNITNMTFGSTNFDLGENLMLTEDGAVVFNVTFTAPTEPGIYDLTFEELSVYDINMSLLDPKKTDGWIEVLAEETTTTTEEPVESSEETTTTTEAPIESSEETTTTTEEPVESSEETTTTTEEPPVESSEETTTTEEPASSEETTTTTEAPIESSEETTTTTEEPAPSEETTTTTEKPPVTVGDAGMWIIGTATVAPGETVTIPVTVTGDKNGINSFIMKMGNEGLNGVAPTAESAEKGNAYGEQLSFVPNVANLTFGSTNFALGENLMLTEDGAVVFNVTFTAPTQPGKYDLTFADLSVYDINMSLLNPEKQDGWIEVVAEETTTTSEAPVESSDETTTTTEAPPESSDETTTTTEAPPESSDETTTTTEAPPESSDETTTTTEAPPESSDETTTTTEAPPESSDETTTTTEAPPESSDETTTTTEEPIASSDETTTTTEAPPESSETTTTSEPDVPPIDSSDSGSQKPQHEYTATWTIGKVDGYAGQPVEVPITVSADIAEALTYNLYDFKIKVADGPVFTPSNVRSGSAYSEMSIEANGFEVAATNTTGDSVGYNNAVIVYLTFDLPEDLAAGKYAVEFDGDVVAHDRNLDTFDITEENGYIMVIPGDVSIDVIDYKYDLETLSKFYFSHDHRTFIGDGLLKEDLISIGTLMSRPVYSDPTLTEQAEWTVADLDKTTFSLKNPELDSPKAIFDTNVVPTLTGDNGIAFFKDKIAFTLSTTFVTYDSASGEIVEKEQKDVDTLYDGTPIVTGDVYIGVKGDTDLNGTVNAADAAKDLVYAAESGAGLDPKILTVESDMISAIQAEGEEAATALENFVYFLSDVTDESEDHGKTSNILDGTGAAINAADAAKVLVYAAESGAGLDPDWYELLDKPLPRYTEAIGPRPAADTTE